MRDMTGPSDQECFEALSKIVRGGLMETIRAHGPIDAPLIGSATKRIVPILVRDVLGFQRRLRTQGGRVVSPAAATNELIKGLGQTIQHYQDALSRKRARLKEVEAERNEARAEASRLAAENARLRSAVDQLARLAGPGFTTTEALRIVEGLTATEGERL